MKDGDAKVGLETEVETGKDGVKRDWGVRVGSGEQYSGRRLKRVEKVYYMSDPGVSGRRWGRTEGGLQYR